MDKTEPRSDLAEALEFAKQGLAEAIDLSRVKDLREALDIARGGNFPQ